LPLFDREVFVLRPSRVAALLSDPIISPGLQHSRANRNKRPQRHRWKHVSALGVSIKRSEFLFIKPNSESSCSGHVGPPLLLP
jgi:hypothetical protein